jgi:trigger factor
MNPTEYAFAFEVGLKPEFEIADLSKEQITRYVVTVTDEMINQEIERLQLRHGKMTEPQEVTGDDNVLNLTFIETDERGSEIESGIRKDTSVMVKYFSEEYRPSLIGKKKEDIVTVKLAEAFNEKESEWILNDLGVGKDASATEKFFKLLINKVEFIERAEMNEEFFKVAYPAKEIKTEDEFRNAVKEDIQTYWNTQSRNHLQHEVYHVLLDHTKIDFPEAFLKKWLQNSGDKPKTEEQIEHEYPGFVKQLKWTLITDKVLKDNNIEVAPDDIKDFARQQLFGYMGMGAMDEEQPWIAEYINRMMHDKKFVEDAYNRIQTNKIFEWAETKVNAVDQPVSVEEFTKELEKHKHHHH